MTKPEAADSNPEKKLLIIEDEAIIALHLKNLAQQVGLKVEGICFSCREALEIVTKKEIDIVFLDIYLKDKDRNGIDLARQLNNEFGITNIIYITANTDAKTKEEANATEHIAYLQKPVELHHIKDALKIL